LEKEMNMAAMRTVRQSWASRPTLEGAGVRLRRAFGFDEVPRLDPFLLLDDFRGDNPRDYLAGFPWHPHRGIETITYMLDGEVEHGDSLGNSGVIRPGDVQWMTAGSGIIHQEMPKGNASGRMGGFQLWANLPASQKMMDPRYRDVSASTIPVVETAGGATVRVIAGTVDGTSGPVTDVVIQPEYLDVTVPAAAEFRHGVPAGHTVLAYVIEGSAGFSPEPEGQTRTGYLALFGDGDELAVTAGKAGVRFLLVSGKPIREPVAWYGPIVMNTDEELQVAFREYRYGTFIKKGATR
jgi:redox-sensitive bicupin YhaK (pirin superfamily)